MSPLQLFSLAVVAMVGLAGVRVARVRVGLTPLPEGKAKLAFRLAFPILPPIALGALIQVPAGGDPLSGVAWVPLYVVMLGVVAILVGLLSLVVRLVVRGRPRQLLMLALLGSEGEPDAAPLDPPMTATLAESLARVTAANVVFPRGLEFPGQIDRVGFLGAWDALDAATRTLEGQIIDDNRLGLGVALAASATAKDARSRLETLRRLARDHGQAWAVA